jgi:hypothetical protein
MTEFTYSNVKVEKDYRNDGMTDQWIVTFDLQLNGDTYKVRRVYEFGEYGERELSISLDGIDLTDEREWPGDTVPHVVRALGDQIGDDADAYWVWDTLTDWVWDTFLGPVLDARDKAEEAATAALSGTTGTGSLPDA